MRPTLPAAAPCTETSISESKSSGTKQQDAAFVVWHAEVLNAWKVQYLLTPKIFILEACSCDN